MIHLYDCAHCGVPTECHRAASKPAPRFCSTTCSGLARRRREERTCASCGTAFECKPAESTRYCSQRCAWDAHRGAGNGRYIGGRRLDAQGYIEVLTPDHPAARNGYVYEHRLVVEAELGRYLTTDEIVHHENGLKDDNRPENLRLMTRAEHTAHHMKETT